VINYYIFHIMHNNIIVRRRNNSNFRVPIPIESRFPRIYMVFSVLLSRWSPPASVTHIIIRIYTDTQYKRWFSVQYQYAFQKYFYVFICISLLYDSRHGFVVAIMNECYLPQYQCWWLYKILSMKRCSHFTSPLL